MSINLSIRFQHPDAVSQQVRYQRIDNIANPVWVNVQPNPVTSPATIATNIPAGQYAIGSTPIYADGRTCTETVVYTDPCPGVISITAVIQGGVLIVSYLAPPSVPKVRITVGFPNGGSSVANYVNNGNDIPIPIPNLTGDFTVSGQSVCDESSNFYSAPSATTTVTNTTTNVTIVSGAAGIVINTLVGIGGFTLPQNVNPGDSITGNHGAFFATISFTFTGMPLFAQNATLEINGTVVQCVNIPNTNGGGASFNSVSAAATDQIRISFNGGVCP